MLPWLALFAVAGPQPYFPPQYGRMPVTCANGRVVPAFDTSTRDRYGRMFENAEEPSLYVKAVRGDADSLRFTWIPAFDPPVTVRIEGFRTASPRMVAVRFGAGDGAELGRIIDRMSRLLSVAEAEGLRRRLLASNPLTLTSAECDMGVDGAEWIVERAVGRRYKMIARNSPSNGHIRSTGMAMLRLTGWTFADIY